MPESDPAAPTASRPGHPGAAERKPIWSAAQDLGWEPANREGAGPPQASAAGGLTIDDEVGAMGSPIVAGLHVGLAALALGVVWWAVSSTGDDVVLAGVPQGPQVEAVTPVRRAPAALAATELAAAAPAASSRVQSDAPAAREDLLPAVVQATPPPAATVEAPASGDPEVPADASEAEPQTLPELATPVRLALAEGAPKIPLAPTSATAPGVAPAPPPTPDVPAPLARQKPAPAPQEAAAPEPSPTALPASATEPAIDFEEVVWTTPTPARPEAALVTSPASTPTPQPTPAPEPTPALDTPQPQPQPQLTKPEVSAPPAEAPARSAASTPTLSRGGHFYGLPAGMSTVYVIDASGSLLDTLPFAIQELRRAIASLTPEQDYAVFFFQGARVLEAPPFGLVEATRPNVRATLDWLDPARAMVHASGRTDAIPALTAALALQPDTVFLLSDGITGHRDPAAERRRLVSLIERVQGRTAVHTVQWIDAAPLAARGRMGTLELLSALTQGRHRYVGLDDVRPRPEP